jgi:hypothetical protein
MEEFVSLLLSYLLLCFIVAWLVRLVTRYCIRTLDFRYKRLPLMVISF